VHLNESRCWQQRANRPGGAESNPGANQCAVLPFIIHGGQNTMPETIDLTQDEPEENEQSVLLGFLECNVTYDCLTKLPAGPWSAWPLKDLFLPRFLDCIFCLFAVFTPYFHTGNKFFDPKLTRSL
jgi:hypothetical protein